MSPAYAYRAFCVFRDQPDKKTYYVGINAKDLKDSHLYGLDLLEPFPEKPTKLWVRRAAVQAFPHLPFVLADEVIPSCAPFEPLQITIVNKSDRAVGRHGEGRFGLSQDHCRRWKKLEKQLRIVAEALFRFAKKTNGVKFVKSFVPFGERYLPSAWKYDVDYPTQQEALQVLHHSYAGYQWLMALISYGIILARTKDDKPQHPLWAIYLQDHCNMEPSFVDAIKASPLNNFTRQRVGVYVTQESIDPSWASHIPYMEQGRCPIYIQWPSSNSWHGEFAAVMENYRPPVTVIQQAEHPSRPPLRLRSPSPSTLSSPSTYDRPGSSFATTVDGNAVDVFRDDPDDYDEHWESAGPSGQRPGESMDDFFARRKTENSRILSSMSTQRHQTVLDREKHAMTRGFSGGKKGPQVYVWLTNTVTGWIKRVWVIKSLASDAFESYNKATRRFDAINNCWDCYSGWASDFTPDRDGYDDDDGDDFPDMRPVSSVPLTQSSLTPDGAYTASTSTSSSSSTPTQPTTNDDVVMRDPVRSSTPHPPQISPTLSSSLGTVSSSFPPLPPAFPHPTSPSVHPSAPLLISVTIPSTPPDDRVSMPPVVSSPSPRPPSPASYPSDNQNDVAMVPPCSPPLYEVPPSNLQYYIPIVQDFREAFVDTLYYRYGFLCEEDDENPPDVTEGEVEDGEVEEGEREEERTLYHAMRLFMAHRDELSQKYRSRFLQFAAMLTRGGSDPRLWDLDSSSSRVLPCPPTSNNDVFSINFIRNSADSIVLYHVMPPLEQEFSERFYHLAVPFASTAVECYRRKFVTISGAAQRLVDCGKSFRTLMPPTRRKKYGPPRPPVLPHRNRDYIFTYPDFVTYEAERDRLFQYPHARAALLDGGIVWRLAVDCLDPHDALKGPSDSANDFGFFVLLPDGTQVVDDCLADDERDLICGTYIVYTGQGEQISQKSWWPKQSTWTSSCQYSGYWTEACEQWYQKRLKDIIAGTAKPKTAGEWKKDLRSGAHNILQVNRYHERAASLFLSTS